MLIHTSRRPDRWQGHKSKSAAVTCVTRALPGSISADPFLVKRPLKYTTCLMAEGLKCILMFTPESLSSFEMKNLSTAYSVLKYIFSKKKKKKVSMNFVFHSDVYLYLHMGS